MEADCKINVRLLKQLGVQHSSAAIATLYNSIQSAECVCHVHNLCAFCHFIGATSELRFMHRNGVQVKPDGLFMGGGAGMPH